LANGSYLLEVQHQHQTAVSKILIIQED
jgi:hypothetical protein